MKNEGSMARVKLDTPLMTGRILRRKRLLGELKANLDKKLILICADAGYGKTTLLAQFCRELKRPFIFCNLDSRDNDAATFFNNLVAGMQRHAPGFGTRVRSVVDEKRGHEVVVGTFINEFLERISGEFYIILDDYHRLNKNRAIIKAINYFLRHLPSNLHFLISSRTTPSIYLSYYLAKQELLHLGKEHLQFDIEETKALLRDVYGLEIEEEDIAQIAELSEGWVTVIQLILQKLSVAGGAQVRQTLDNYIASGEELFDYFAHEILNNQSEKICDFMMKTSILEYLHPAVCDRILGMRGAREILDHLEREHIFVLRSGQNLVYHPLFQDFLYKKLRDVYAIQYIRRLHRKASEYFYAKKEFSEAVKHLIGARRYARAAGILYKHYDYWHDANEFAAFVQLVDMIPGSVIEKYPYLLLKKATMYSEMKKVEKSLKIVDKALRRLRLANDHRGMMRGYTLKWHASHLLMQSRKGLYYARKAYQLAGRRKSKHKARVMMNLATAYRILGVFNKAQKILEAALQMARVLKDPKLECDALHMLGMLYYNMSDLSEAEKVFMEIVNKCQDHVYPLELAYIYRTIASIAVDNGDVVKAEKNIERAENIVEQYNDRYLSHYLVLLKGRVSVYIGDYRQAIAFFEQVIELNRRIDVKISDLYALLDLVDVHLRMNNVMKARQAMDGARSVLNQGQDIPQHVIGVLTAQGRVETAEHKYTAALASLKAALKLSKKVSDPLQVLLVYYAFSQYHLARKKISEALDWFKKYIALGEKHNFDAFLVSAGREQTELFEFALEQDYKTDFVLEILKRIDTDRAREIVKEHRPMASTFDLVCNYLGTLELRDVHGRVIVPKWRTKRARMIFTMLSAKHPKGCTKDELVNACWPKKDAEQAVHSLQVELSSLRKMLLGMVDRRFSSENLIMCRNDNYAMNPRLCIRKDIQEFEVLVREAAAREGADRAGSMNLYGQALDIYRGDFCTSLSFDWCAEMRAYYREMVLTVLKKMARMRLEDGNPKAALTFYHRAQQLDQYDEAIHIGIMRCLTALKDADGVQRQYQRLVQTLREFDIPQPSNEAVEIYKESFS
ncbi:MAG: tetratricopeptide repeat protein [candidate division WOR-3 bacterium]|jgi:ATP/maltotriose-dependent transcriptional regulator MalT/DNA-binding SARP family transcriptional activator